MSNRQMSKNSRRIPHSKPLISRNIQAQTTIANPLIETIQRAGAGTNVLRDQQRVQIYTPEVIVRKTEASLSAITCRTGETRDGRFNEDAGIKGKRGFCISIDPSKCPSFGGALKDISLNLTTIPALDQGPENVSVSVGGVSVTQRREWLRTQICTYNVNDMQTPQQIQDWRNRLILGNTTTRLQAQQILDEQIMPYFCALSRSSDCPANAPTCSGFTQTGQVGALCRAWVAQNLDKNPLPIQISMESYCRSNPAAEECRCIRRQEDSNFRQIVDAPAGITAPPFCWWRPCNDTNRYLVPPDVRKVLSCPNICQNLVLISQISNSNVDVLIDEQSNNCQTPAPTDVETPPTPPPPPPPPPPPQSPSIWTSWWLWATVIGIVSILVVLVIILSRGKSS